MRESKYYPGINLDTWQPKRNISASLEFKRPAPAPAPAFTPAPGLQPVTSSENLKKRAGKKLQTFIFNKELAALNSPLKSYYLRAMNCCNEIRQEGKEFTANYCGCRSCKICTDIRQSKLTGKYKEVLEAMKQKRFVTLTVRNIRADVNELRWLQDDMYKHHRRVQDLLRKHKINVPGIRKYEPIPAKDLKGFHPHFHWIIDGQITEDKIFDVWASQKLDSDTLEKLIDGFVYETVKDSTGKNVMINGKLARTWQKKFAVYMEESAANKLEMLANMKAEMLVQLWLKKYKGFADRLGQDVCEVTPGSESELFKYTTKLMVKTKNNLDVIPVKLLDMVFNATKGVRTVMVTGYITARPREVLKSETNPAGERIFIDYKRVPKSFWLENEFRAIGDVPPLLNTISGIEPMPKGYILVKRISNYYRKLLSYLTYKELTELEDEDINANLHAQHYEDAPDQSTVYSWRDDNWYDISTGQPLAAFKPDSRINKLLESLQFD